MSVSALLGQYRECAGVVRRAADAAAGRPAPPGEWPSDGVIAHLADAELVRAERIRRILADDDPLILPFDENLWHERLARGPRDEGLSLALYEAAILTTAELLTALSAGHWERAGVHAESGAVTITELVERGVRHAAEHAAQLVVRSS